MKHKNRALLLGCVCSLALITSCGGTSAGVDEPDAGDENCEFESTFAAIQSQIFDAKGCTNAACHGQPAATATGGLDLREGFAYENLLRVASEVDPDVALVVPGDARRSLLFLKLAAKQGGEVEGVSAEEMDLDARGLGDPMPFGNVDPLSTDELALLRSWIKGGAQENAIVKGTEDLLACDEPVVADPNKLVPPDPPAAGEGVQFYSGPWHLGSQAEDEVCFVSYYNFAGQIPNDVLVPCPEEWGGDSRQCFATGRNELNQDPQSHHSIVDVYVPKSDPTGGDWDNRLDDTVPTWSCLGGDNAGSPCDPNNAGVCGARSQCTTPVRTNVACIGYPWAPADFSAGAGPAGGGSTRPGLSGAQQPTQVFEAWPGVYGILPVDGFIVWNSHAFNLTQKDTTIEQWINIDFVKAEDRQYLQRQIFEAGNIFGMTPVLPNTEKEICMTWVLPRYSNLTSLSSHMHVHGKLFRIWMPPNEHMGSRSCVVGEGDCAAPAREPDYLNRLYDDPLYTYYLPPLTQGPGFDLSSADADQRTFKACAVYDNGLDKPLKRESTKPNTPVCDGPLPIAFCGCPDVERRCDGGSNVGELCGGDDANCPDAACDACPLRGGITTDDEMFIPLGTYHVVPPV